MKNGFFNKLCTLILIYILCYVGLFITLHIYVPEFGDVSINVKPNYQNPELQEVTITIDKPLEHYYLLIYEESNEDTWLYFHTKTYDKISEFLISQFVPNFKNKYVLLEGNQFENSFSFTMHSKYPISYRANKESKFHLFYIAPHKIFLFPTFYYGNHYVFFVDPIM